MKDHEKDRIAAAFHQLRPDWPTKSIRTLLDRPTLTDRARRDVIVALGWVSAEEGTATPARVLENGPWWKAAGTTGEVTRRHATPASACHTCGREMHAADLVCDQPTARPNPSAAYTDHAATAKAMLRRSR
jgi:hypothetical protein